RILAVMVLDLDRRKAINDPLGRDFGDQLLCQIAERMRAELTSSDFIARLAGAEFVIVIKRNSEVELEQFCQTLQQEIAAPMEISGHRFAITASGGICRLSDSEPEVDALIRDRKSVV